MADLDAVASRVFTLQHSIERLRIDSAESVFTLQLIGELLQLHVSKEKKLPQFCPLGCDGVELSSLCEFSTRYALLFEYFARRRTKKLILGLIGPSLPVSSAASNHFQFSVEGTDCCLFADCREYHDYMRSEDFVAPDMLALFNAGLWGYDSWKPTLSALTSLHRVAVLVTSYTLEEAEDDNDVIVESMGVSIRWNWGEEPNPDKSSALIARTTAATGRAYSDNGAYQCFTIL
jgi:hypothetical protein